MIIRKFILLIGLLIVELANTPLLASKIITVKDSYGECQIINITPEEAKERAIIQAKKEALRKAGIPEQISCSNVLVTTFDNTFQQIFNEISTIEINGAILNYTITKQRTRLDKYNNIFYEITINADVIIYDTKKDLEFDFEIKGIDHVYQDGDALSFSFQPNHNGYLKIFTFTDSTAFLLYPYQDSSKKNNFDTMNYLFKKNLVFYFPLNKNIGNKNNITGYTLSTNVQNEINYIVFVFTKTNIPFNKQVNMDHITRWIYEIPPDLRCVKFFSILIKK